MERVGDDAHIALRTCPRTAIFWGCRIETVRRIFEGTRTQVIYMTAYVEYCQDVYETDHVWLLRKPFSGELGTGTGRAPASRIMSG